MLTYNRFPGQEHVAGNSKIPSIMYYDRQGAMQTAGAEAEGAAIVSLAEDEDWQKVELYVFPTALPLARAHGRPAKF